MNGRDGRILSIDLGTSRVKVAALDRSFELDAEDVTYSSQTDSSGRSEQRTSDWTAGVASASTAIASRCDGVFEGVVLSAQMPTLVAIDADGRVIEPAVTWQDARADALVTRRLDVLARARVARVAGTPIDGRYIIPMHLRRLGDEGYDPRLLLSAKDYLFYVLTGEAVTDPSTASGFGNYDLVARAFSAELGELWGISSNLLPRVEAPTYHAPLTRSGAQLLGLGVGTPVWLGAADSVCAHYAVTRAVPDATSVIDGSSTVIITSAARDVDHDTVLRTPLVEDTIGVELDLLATGASLAWLAGVLATTTGELEALALATSDPASSPVRFTPYLAGGEQGVLWRSDLTGEVSGLSLATSRSELALALFEGIAFETVRCLDYLADHHATGPVVTLAGRDSALLGPALIAAATGRTTLAARATSPSLLGAAMIAAGELGWTSNLERVLTWSPLPTLDARYLDRLSTRARDYLATTPRDDRRSR